MMEHDEEIWPTIRGEAADYKNRRTPLFRGDYYSLWVRTAGTETIAITKAGPAQNSLPSVENDGGRITTFHAEIGQFMEFINSYHSLLENDYEYKDLAYRVLTKKIIQSHDDSISKEMLKIQILSLISESPMEVSDFREAIGQNSEIVVSSIDNEKTGHGRYRWETNLQNAIADLKQEGKIGHIGHNQYISPVFCHNPLDAEDFWLDVRENSMAKYEDEIICSWDNHKYGTGNYFLQSVSPDKITFRREPASGNTKIDEIRFDKKRLFGMANSLNAVGGKGTRVTIGGARKLYSELLLSLSSLIDIKEDKWIIITDTVEDSLSNFNLNDSNSEKDLRKRALKPGVQREGATKFRKEVLQNYGHKCAISGISAVDTIQAAHIRPYNGPETNHLANGIALRSDIHRLFDLGKIRINPDDLQIILHPDIESEYREICSDKLDLGLTLIPPNKGALELVWCFDKNKWF
jgi:hypothetical protein